MFTIEQRDAVRDRVVAIAKDDPRIRAGAVVGSLALGTGDLFSDLDLTFAVADEVPVAAVLDDWTRILDDEFDAITLFDLAHEATRYRVFLFPDGLQCDLSMTPATRFVPSGPRFRLLFGKIAGPGPDQKPPDATDLFGWGVIYALHSRACIERRRPWQAEHYIGAVRDHALSLACLRHGMVAVQARGYDDLPPEILASFDLTHIGSHEPERLREALAAVTRALLSEGKTANVPAAADAAQRLADIL